MNETNWVGRAFTRAACVAVALAIWQGAASAHAQTPPAPTPAEGPAVAEARTRFQRGQQLTQEGRFSEALVEFEVGYGLTHRPLFLFNMAECARSLGDYARARTLYERYMAEDHDATLAATARQRIASLPTPAQTPGASGSGDANGAASHGAQGTSPDVVVFTPDETARDANHRHGVALVPSPTPHDRAAHDDDDDGTIFEKWPFWVGVGAVVATAVTIGVVVSRSGSSVACGADCVDFR